MAVTISSFTAVGATTARLNIAGSGGTAPAIQVQLAPRKDFEWCVAPIFEVPNAAFYDLVGLNQAQSYFARVRFRNADGSLDAWSAVKAFRTTLAASHVTAPGSVVIDPAIIVLPEEIISWTPGSEAPGFPAKNVSRDAPVAWRSVDATGQHRLVIEHSGAPWDTLAILNTNLPEAATISVRVGATASAAGTASALIAQSFRASANLPGRPGYHGLFRLAAPASQPFTQIELYGTTPGGVLHVEHVLLGLNRKSKNHALEKTETPVHLGSKERTRAGNPDEVSGYKLRRVEFDLAWLTETQSETLYHELGGWLDRPILAVPNSKPGGYLHDRILYGDLKTIRNTQPSSLHYTRTIGIESLI